MKNTNIHIGVNGSMLDEHPTGVGIYSLNVINHLFALYQKEECRELAVFTPTKTSLDKNIKTINLPGLLKSSQYGKVAAFTRFVWNTFYYPLQARKFDLLLSTTTHGSFLLRNQIITIHDLLSLRFNNISVHQRFYFKYLLPYLVAKAKLIIAVSETTKRDIVNYLHCPESKVRVVYNGYDDSLYNCAQPIPEKIGKEYKVENYFLAIGPTYPHKNFEFLIDVYSALDAGVKKTHPLVIAGGKKEYLATLEKIVVEKKQSGYIYFIGYVPLALMPSLYREAFALVFPSLFEGFGFPLLEAMACACPVIASDISSMPEVCGDAVLYFDPYSKPSLFMQLKSIIENEKLRNELRQRGIEQAKKFSWSKTVRELKIIIEESLQESVLKN